MPDTEQAAIAKSAQARALALLARVKPERVQLWLAAAAAAVGAAAAVSTLGRGVWLDEFWTLASSEHGLSVSGFLAVMARDVHPLLHYGLVYLAQALGLTDVAGLRALNALGVPLVVWAGWLAWRRKAATASQLCVLAALYASSGMFLDYFAELRAYFLLFAASTATALVWRVLAREAREGRAWTPAALVAWTVCLAALVNLHYFATLLGGLLTLALLGLRRGRGRGAITLAALSLLAAAPAIATALVQAAQTDTGIVGWVQTGRIDAALVIADSVWSAMAHNVVALGCAIVTCLVALERRDGWAALSDEIVLAGVLCLYFALLLAINLVRPIVIDRYMIASGGAVVVLVALLAAGPGTPRWGPAAAALFALAVQARGLHSGSFLHDGWRASADAVAQLEGACPGSPVLIDPVGESPQVEMFANARRYGLRYYAAREGLAVSEIGPGGAVPTGGACPTLIWLEHFEQLPAAATAETMLRRIRVSTDRPAELLRVGSGVIVIVR